MLSLVQAYLQRTTPLMLRFTFIVMRQQLLRYSLYFTVDPLRIDEDRCLVSVNRAVFKLQGYTTKVSKNEGRSRAENCSAHQASIRGVYVFVSVFVCLSVGVGDTGVSQVSFKGFFGLSFQIFCRQPAEKRIFQASGLIQPPPNTNRVNTRS